MALGLESLTETLQMEIAFEPRFEPKDGFGAKMPIAIQFYPMRCATYRHLDGDQEIMEAMSTCGLRPGQLETQPKPLQDPPS